MELIRRFLVIEDSHERLALLVDRARRLPPLPDEDRVPANLVQGCSSQVWLVGELAHGVCRFRMDADSTLVKGLAAVVCEVYQDAPPEQVAAFESSLLESLHLMDHLTLTRRHGLAQVERTIRAFAAAQLSAAA